MDTAIAVESICKLDRSDDDHTLNGKISRSEFIVSAARHSIHSLLQ